VRQKNYSFEALGWRKAEWADHFRRGDLIDLVFTPQINEYRGERLLYLSLEGAKRL